MPGHTEHDMLAMNSWDLQLPAQNPTPYKFVGFGWNPAGHERPGVYDLPHFDFHFFRVGTDVKNSINAERLQAIHEDVHLRLVGW